MSNVPLSKPIRTVEVVHIWTLQPIPSYCRNPLNQIQENVEDVKDSKHQQLLSIQAILNNYDN